MIRHNLFLCFAFIHNVTLRVKVFEGKTSNYVVKNAFAKHPHVTQNALDRWYLIKLKMFFINLFSDDCSTV